MKKEFFLKLNGIVLLLVLLSTSNNFFAQEKEYLKDGSIEEQITHLTNRSTSWENHKVVLNSWLSNLKKNVLDTIALSKQEVELLKKSLAEKENEIKNLRESLQKASSELSDVQHEKDTFIFLGINFSKGLFLTTVITLILVLMALIIASFGLYKRSFDTIRKTRDELDTINTEYENYRQESRKKHEQLVVQHHREMQKLKGL
ncbi:MAG: hypothetical protein FWH18_06475 [Marinilabiliaceae bacterium]|nr:hypothetical protein [Marinilabiliaceae bacterium]